jgi:hypothetical protein
MKDSTMKKVEFVTNISLITVALIISVILVRKGFMGEQERPDSQRGPTAGTHISLPGVDWGNHKKNILLIVSTRCSFCSGSAGFYRQLADEISRNKDSRLIALLPQEEAEGNKYLNELKVPVEEVLQLKPDSIAVSGFPTIILVNSRGIVEEAWVGQLPSDQESEVLSRLKCEDCGST